MPLYLFLCDKDKERLCVVDASNVTAQGQVRKKCDMPAFWMDRTDRQELTGTQTGRGRRRDSRAAKRVLLRRVESAHMRSSTNSSGSELGWVRGWLRERTEDL